MNPRGRGALLAVLLLLACASCRMELDVDVTMQRDGSGTVAVLLTVDPDALERVGGDLAGVIDLAGFRADGWRVEGPSEDEAGETTLRLTQAFADPAAGEAVLASLTGEDGPLTGFRLDRESGLWQDRWTFQGQADFSRGAGSAASTIDDDAVQQLADQLGQSLDRLIQVRVRVRLPGEVSSNATTQAENGAVWAIGLDDGPVELAAEGTDRQERSYVLTGVAGLVLVIGAITLLIRLAIRRTDASV
ncbi:MAG: hypothetical protein M3Z03_05955 [Actinomycetota bacterium]|nr:hypothetical protein [Actinomycetota bacterium]